MWLEESYHFILIMPEQFFSCKKRKVLTLGPYAAYDDGDETGSAEGSAEAETSFESMSTDISVDKPYDNGMVSPKPKSGVKSSSLTTASPVDQQVHLFFLHYF